MNTQELATKSHSFSTFTQKVIISFNSYEVDHDILARNAAVLFRSARITSTISYKRTSKSLFEYNQKISHKLPKKFHVPIMASHCIPLLISAEAKQLFQHQLPILPSNAFQTLATLYAQSYGYSTNDQDLKVFDMILKHGNSWLDEINELQALACAQTDPHKNTFLSFTVFIWSAIAFYIFQDSPYIAPLCLFFAGSALTCLVVSL